MSEQGGGGHREDGHDGGDDDIAAPPAGRTHRAVRSARAHPFRTMAALGVVAVLCATALAMSWMRWSTRGATYSPATVPPAPVAIVFGAGLRPDGTPTPYLAARLDTAAALYREGTVQVLLVTGDHGTVAYDEVGAMTRWLVAHGVPASKVVADHAGFDTYDSCQRARRIFGVDRAIVVTQGFHVRRAVFSCRQAGIATVGVAAATPGGQPAANELREVPASLKAAFDAVVDPGPRYLGRQETGVDDALADD